VIAYPSSLKAIGGARTGIAPVNLLDVQDVNGNCYYWSDRPINAPVVITGETLPSYIPSLGTLSALPAGQFQVMAYPTEFSLQKVGNISGYISSTAGMMTYFEGPPLASEGKLEWKNFQPLTPIPENAIIESEYVIFIGDGGTASNNFPPSGITQIYPGFTGLLSNIEYEAIFENYSSSSGTCLVKFIGILVRYSIPGVTNSISEGSGLSGFSSYFSKHYVPWLVEIPEFTFHRSQVTDTGAFLLQNLSGDTLSRDFEKILRRSTLEGAFFVYRCWQADAEAAWLEVHGTLTVDPVGVDTVSLKGNQLINAAQEDTPLEIYSETCQLQWGGPRCGATGSTECQYSYQTCQQPNRIMVEANSYEKNFGDTSANTAFNIINRRRTI